MNSFPCSRSDCDNKTEYGYCKSTVCIKPLNGASGYIPEVVHGPDVVPVVRCRECKFLHLSSLEKWCWNENSICYAGKVTNNWYCADGKRKDGKDEI